jgi:hypothetical protein
LHSKTPPLNRGPWRTSDEPWAQWRRASHQARLAKRTGQLAGFPDQESLVDFDHEAIGNFSTAIDVVHRLLVRMGFDALAAELGEVKVGLPKWPRTVSEHARLQQMLERLRHVPMAGVSDGDVRQYAHELKTARQLCVAVGELIGQITADQQRIRSAEKVVRRWQAHCSLAEASYGSPSNGAENPQKKGAGTQPEHGVSLLDVGMQLEDGDEKAAHSIVDRLIGSKKITAKPIGKCTRDGRACLYRLDDLLSDVKRIYGLNSRDEAKLKEHLQSKLRAPR